MCHHVPFLSPSVVTLFPWSSLADSLQSLLTKYGECCPHLLSSSASLLVTSTGPDETSSVVNSTAVSTINDEQQLYPQPRAFNNFTLSRGQ
jgi:hypothetical protein